VCSLQKFIGFFEVNFFCDSKQQKQCGENPHQTVKTMNKTLDHRSLLLHYIFAKLIIPTLILYYSAHKGLVKGKF
jgi:hypothetical protein